jgi:uncharacterized membrane protein
MFKSIGTTLITGMITVLPIALTLYLLYWLAVSSEQLLGGALQWALPRVVYFPGLGTIAGLVLVFLVGLLMKAVLVRQLFSLGEGIVYRLPIIKSIYSAIRDLFDFFSPKKEGFGRVVIVSVNNMEMIGFITQEDPARLPESFGNADSVLVYIPMSYMIGGFTLLIPKHEIRPCQMNMDEAMRFVLTAGITGKNEGKSKAKAGAA